MESYVRKDWRDNPKSFRFEMMVLLYRFNVRLANAAMWLMFLTVVAMATVPVIEAMNWILATGSNMTGKAWPDWGITALQAEMERNIHMGRGFALIGSFLIIPGWNGVHQGHHWWGWLTPFGVIVWLMYIGAILPFGTYS